MQERLRPGVAPRKMVVAHQMLVKMLGREAAVSAAISASASAARSAGTRLAEALAWPPVQQACFVSVLKTLAPAPERPLPDTQKLRRFHLAELRPFVTTQNVQNLDHPRTQKGFRPAHPKPPQRV